MQRGWVVYALILVEGLCVTSGKGVAAGGKPSTSVILISVDTLRADHLGCYGYRGLATPHVDALSEPGTLFVQANSQVPLTLPSHVSLLTSTYPFVNGVEENGDHLSPGVLTLAAVLRSHGYRTGAFVGGFVLDRRFGLNQGFDDYDSPFDLHREAGKDPGEIKRPGKDVAADAERWLAKNSGQPFFLFLHLYDLHTPYVLASGKRAPSGARGYDAELAEVDRLVGQFWDFLQRRNLLQNALVVFTSDHGESLGEHGETTHGYFIYQSTLRVPLIFHWPSRPLGFPARVSAPVSLLDVAPTILECVDVPRPEQFQGQSLLGLLRQRAGNRDKEIYSESLYARDHFGTSALRSLRVANYQYIEAPRPELYDLARDPREVVNLCSARQSEALGLRERLIALRSRYGRAPGAAARAVSPEAAERLRSLGYLAASTPHRASAESGPDPKDRIAAYEKYGRALLLASAGRVAEADTQFNQLLAKDPDLIDVRLSLGLNQQKLGRYAEAAGNFQEVLRADPQLALAHFDLAVSWADLRRLDDAIRELQATLAIDPSYSRAEELLGTIWLEKHDYDRARSQFEHLLSVDPTDYAAHYNLGVLATLEKQWSNAEQQLQAAIQIDPSSSEAHNALGSLYLEQGRLDDAQHEFERAVQLRPAFAWPRYNLAMVLHQKKRDREAIRELQGVLATDPQFRPARQALDVLERSKL